MLILWKFAQTTAVIAEIKNPKLKIAVSLLVHQMRTPLSVIKMWRDQSKAATGTNFLTSYK